MEDEIYVDVDLFGATKMSLKVNRSDAVSVISEHILTDMHVKKYHFLHEDCVLSPAFSFAFYGITTGSSLRVVDSDKPSLSASRRFSHVPNLERRSIRGLYSDLDKEIVCSLRDSNVMTEIAKVRDQCFLRMETNGSSHRRILKCFKQLDPPVQTPSFPSAPTRVENMRLASPSDKAMPQFIDDD